MTQEEKDLLIKDLCSRLPYGVKAYVKNWSKLERKWFEDTYIVKSIHPSLNTILLSTDLYSVEVILGYDDFFIKPYLFPLSSMTEEQKEEHQDLINNHYNFDANGNVFTLQDFYCKYHFDYRGLIPMDLANDATGLNIYSDNLVMNNKNNKNNKHLTIECYDCHEVINFTEDDVIENWYVKCPCCGEEISILP